MKIGVLADSHDHLPPLRQAIALFLQHKVAAVVHAGDIVAPFAAKLLAPPFVPASLPVHCCYGNNDGEKAGLKKVLPQIVDGPLRIEIADRVIVVHHSVDWLSAKDIAGADVVITGHDHEAKSEQRDGVLYLNPGECCGWLGNGCTAALLDLETLRVEVCDLSD